MLPKNLLQSPNSSNLLGKTALITGATSGIGRAIAQFFLLEKAEVITVGRTNINSFTELFSCEDNNSGSDEALKRISDIQKNWIHLPADLSCSDQRNELIESAWNWRGKIDILVNCAGADILTGNNKTLSFEQKLALLWAVDVQSTVSLSRALGNKMRGQGSGCIINIGWDGARRGLAGDSGELFALIKGAVESFSLSLAQSLAPQVKVNVIAPGWIETQWGKTAPESWQEKIRRQSLIHRWGTPEEIAAAAVFLASPAASLVNGHIIDLNGGFAVN